MKCLILKITKKNYSEINFVKNVWFIYVRWFIFEWANYYLMVAVIIN